MAGAIRTAGLKQLNRQLLLDALSVMDEATKTELSARTRLSVTTCADLLDELLAEKRITELPLARSRGGRPARRFRLNADYEHALCLFASNWDIGGVRLVWRVFDMRGGVRARGEREFEDVTISDILALIAEISAADQLVRVVGVGVPGVIEDGTVGVCDLAELSYTNISRAVADLGLKCVVLNDLNSIAQGFAQTRRVDNRDVVVIAWPRNSLPGAGIFIDGRIRRGLHNFAGEVAHMNCFITKDEQWELLSARETFMRAALPVLCGVISVLAPDEVAVTGALALEHSAEEYRAACAETVLPGYLPLFTLLEKYDDEYLLGLFHECRESLKYPVRLVER